VQQLDYVGFAQVIQTSQQELEEARAEQDFGRCKKLQQKITRAEEKDVEGRKGFEELQRCIRVSSMLADAALEKDDFEKCEKAKARIVEAQKGWAQMADEIVLVVKYGGRGVDVLLSIEEAEEAEALVVKHGVGTIEEARRKEAEEVRTHSTTRTRTHNAFIVCVDVFRRIMHTRPLNSSPAFIPRTP
jgi:hypothetical protein